MITAHVTPGKEKARVLCQAFLDGAPKAAKGHVLYGVTDCTVGAWENAKRKGEDWYWVDNSYFDAVRGQQFRVTKNAVQLPHVLQHQSDGRRFDALGLTFGDVKPPGPNFLFVEQSPDFMRLVAKDPAWAKRELRAIPHALRPWNRNKKAHQRGLLPALEEFAFHGVATHSSAAAVTAALHGYRWVVSPMSALYGVMLTERRPVLKVLADNQFTIQEMQDGKAWAWLNRT